MVPALFVMQDAYGVACDANGHSSAAARIVIKEFSFSIVSGSLEVVGIRFLSANGLMGFIMLIYTSAQ